MLFAWELKSLPNGFSQLFKSSNADTKDNGKYPVIPSVVLNTEHLEIIRHYG